MARTITITHADGDDVGVITDNGGDVADQVRITLAGTAWPSGHYVGSTGVGTAAVGRYEVEYVAEHLERHDERLPWLRCSDVDCRFAPIPDGGDGVERRRTAIREALERWGDDRCRVDDALALFDLIEHGRDAAAAVAVPSGLRGGDDMEGDVAHLATELTRALTLARVGASVLQALVVDDDPMRWTHVLAQRLERSGRVSTWGGEDAQTRAALHGHAHAATVAILSTMRRSVNAWELLAVLAGVSFGGFELTREIEAADRAAAVRTGQAAADALADKKARP